MMVSVNDSKHLNQLVSMEKSSCDPPFQRTYQNLFNKIADHHKKNFVELPVVVEGSELPLIDLNQLYLGDSKRQTCKKLIVEASREWGFFQVVNHGIQRDILEIMRLEQVKLFRKPFEEKKAYKDISLSYRWGTPTATTLQQLSWSEAFHLSLFDVLLDSSGRHNCLSLTMEQFATTVSELAQILADILAEELIGHKTSFFKQTCLPRSCYLRLNRYPPCPIHVPQMLGITSHTDSSFLTVLHQDNIGGLQLMKDGEWIAVKPNSDALIINIGDMFQAWSNDMYKSVEHRVVANPLKNRYSTAYFFCPSHDTVIQSVVEPAVGVYRSFSFGEFRKQVEKDVEIYGGKIGLPRFVAPITQ